MIRDICTCRDICLHSQSSPNIYFSQLRPGRKLSKSFTSTSFNGNTVSECIVDSGCCLFSQFLRGTTYIMRNSLNQALSIMFFLISLCFNFKWRQQDLGNHVCKYERNMWKDIIIYRWHNRYIEFLQYDHYEVEPDVIHLYVWFLYRFVSKITMIW